MSARIVNIQYWHLKLFNVPKWLSKWITLQSVSMKVDDIVESLLSHLTGPYTDDTPRRRGRVIV